MNTLGRNINPSAVLVSLTVLICIAQSVAKPIPDLSATLTLQKNVYVSGEPIILTFTARYTGSRPSIDVLNLDPYGRCGNPYRMEITPNRPLDGASSDPRCASLFARVLSCLLGSQRLLKGELHEERVLLNHFGDFSVPGNYVLRVTRDISEFPQSNPGDPFGGEVIQQFALSVVPAPSSNRLKELFAPYIANLESKSYQRREEAATVISTLPTLFLEPYLVRLLEKSEFAEDAIQGLRRVNSEESRAALFRFITSNISSDSDRRQTNVGQAIKALASMGDAEYAPQFLALMEGKAYANQKTALFTAAARLDPKRARAAIHLYLNSPTAKKREIGSAALAATEQPEAIPALVRLLKDPSINVRASAAAGLMALTRESPTSSPSYWPGKDPASAAPFWGEWLRKNPGLPIHLLRECPQEAAR